MVLPKALKIHCKKNKRQKRLYADTSAKYDKNKWIKILYKDMTV